MAHPWEDEWEQEVDGLFHWTRLNTPKDSTVVSKSSAWIGFGLDIFSYGAYQICGICRLQDYVKKIVSRLPPQFNYNFNRWNINYESACPS